MSVGKRLLIYSRNDPQASDLVAATGDWGCMVTNCSTVEELRGKVEGGEFDVVLVENSEVLRGLISESDPTGQVLQTPLAEIEKRHILRVLAAAGNNKTRAAKILGIDTKTLYNKLKSYNAVTQNTRRRESGEVESN